MHIQQSTVHYKTIQQHYEQTTNTDTSTSKTIYIYISNELSYSTSTPEAFITGPYLQKISLQDLNLIPMCFPVITLPLAE